LLHDDSDIASNKNNSVRAKYAEFIFNTRMLSFSLGGNSPYPVHIHSAWKQGKKLAEIYKN